MTFRNNENGRRPKAGVELLRQDRVFFLGASHDADQPKKSGLSIWRRGGSAGIPGPSGRFRSALIRFARRWPAVTAGIVFAAILLAAAALTRALPASLLEDLAFSLLFYVVAANLLVTAIVGGAIYAYLKSRVRSLRRSMHSRIDDLHSRIDDLVDQLKQRD